METILNDGESLGVILPFSYENIREIFNRHASLLNEVKHPVLVHWDLWSGNIFIIEKHEKSQVEGIIDWERAYWGDPESESAIATNYYGPAVFQGYGRPLPKGRNAAIRHKMYQIYLL